MQLLAGRVLAGPPSLSRRLKPGAARASFPARSAALRRASAASIKDCAIRRSPDAQETPRPLSRGRPRHDPAPAAPRPPATRSSWRSRRARTRPRSSPRSPRCATRASSRAVVALHVDHGLRPGGAEDAACAAAACARLGVPFESVARPGRARERPGARRGARATPRSRGAAARAGATPHRDRPHPDRPGRDGAAAAARGARARAASPASRRGAARSCDRSSIARARRGSRFLARLGLALARRSRRTRRRASRATGCASSLWPALARARARARSAPSRARPTSPARTSARSRARARALVGRASARSRVAALARRAGRGAAAGRPPALAERGRPARRGSRRSTSRRSSRSPGAAGPGGRRSRAGSRRAAATGGSRSARPRRAAAAPSPPTSRCPGPGGYAVPGARGRRGRGARRRRGALAARAPDAAPGRPLPARTAAAGSKKLKSWLIDRKVPREARDGAARRSRRGDRVLAVPELGAVARGARPVGRRADRPGDGASPEALRPTAKGGRGCYKRRSSRGVRRARRRCAEQAARAAGSERSTVPRKG